MISIVEYTEQRKDAFKTLNEEWLRKGFSVEPVDKEILEHPKQVIIDSGGMVFFAVQDDETVGTVALIRINPEELELGKMAVLETMRGQGIGSQLLRHCFRYAKNAGALRIILYSNTILDNAIRLYEKHGFVEIPLDPGPYKRSNIKMEKIL